MKNLSQEQLDKLEDGVSLTIYKGRKRNEKKSVNYKTLSTKSIECDVDKVTPVNYYEVNFDTFIEIEMSNKDTIIGKYRRVEKEDYLKENSIKIEINDKVVYHMDNEEFDNDKLIDYIISYYKKHISKKWKIR